MAGWKGLQRRKLSEGCLLVQTVLLTAAGHAQPENCLIRPNLHAVLTVSTIYQSRDQVALPRWPCRVMWNGKNDLLSRQWCEHWSSLPRSASAVGRYEAGMRWAARHEDREGSLTETC